MDETKTNGVEITTADVKKKHKGNPQNLISTKQMTSEELSEFSRKGGIARGEQRRKQKSLKEIANLLLESKTSRERAENILGDIAKDIPDEDLTNGALLMAKMFNECFTNGTVKSAEFIRDTSGQKPKDEISLTADIMTEADRTLMANMAEILGVKPTE